MREANYSAVPNKCVYPKDTTSETGFILRNFPRIEQPNHELSAKTIHRKNGNHIEILFLTA